MTGLEAGWVRAGAWPRGLSFAVLSLLATPAHAAWNDPVTLSPLIALALAGFALAAMALPAAALRTQRMVNSAARLKIRDFEQQLNEAESALKSEPQLMLVWSGAGAIVERVVGSMRGTARLPDNSDAILAFPSWLESDSAAHLGLCLTELRQSGKAFSIGVKSKLGELLEADGRAAGSLATLRFRPLAGDRRAVTELAYDAEKLAKQVERLSTILDAAPFPVWIRGRDKALTWANQAYIKAVEAPTLVRTLDWLEGEGLVARRGAPHDRRAKTVHLTAKAGPLIRAIEDVATGVRAEMMAGIPEAELAGCLAVLGRIAEGLAALPDAMPPPDREPAHGHRAA